MLRRSLLQAAAALTLAPAGLAAPVGLRRVRPGDPQWPNEAEWARLDAAVGGRLIKPTPLLDACLEDPKGDLCRESLRRLFNPFFIADQAGGTEVSGWYDAWTPAPSARAVAARNVADVQAAVNFARTHDLRLVVKGGAHSYQGTSNAPDSLLVWTRPMRGVSVHDAFVPAGGEGRARPLPAVTVEAGAVWLDVYDAVTTKAGRYVQGGGCTTVGVAGHVQSGGFGSLSKTFGTAAGSLIEAEVVTADGRVRTVNAWRDPDLYWALKGGGGGGFGVVTRLTLRTHPLPDVFGGVSGKFAARTPEAFARPARPLRLLLRRDAVATSLGRAGRGATRSSPGDIAADPGPYRGADARDLVAHDRLVVRPRQWRRGHRTDRRVVDARPEVLGRGRQARGRVEGHALRRSTRGSAQPGLVVR